MEKYEDDDDEADDRAAWLAPELLRRKNAKKTAESDIYALGMTLWEIYEQRKPFEGMSRAEITHRVLNGERPEFKLKNAPYEIEGIIKCCWAKDPRRRPTAETIACILSKVETKKVKKMVRKNKWRNLSLGAEPLAGKWQYSYKPRQEAPKFLHQPPQAL